MLLEEEQDDSLPLEKEEVGAMEPELNVQPGPSTSNRLRILIPHKKIHMFSLFCNTSFLHNSNA